MLRLLFVLSIVLAIGCGFKLPSVRLFDNRIVGGSDALIEDHPHQISLRFYGDHRCGGSIIGKKFVLTAAHCVTGISPSSLQVVAGITDLSSTGAVYEVEQIFVHENYTYLDHDVAVLILQTEVIFSSKIKPIDLARLNPPGNAMVYVSGWGSRVEGGSVSNTLQDIYIPVVNHDNCAKAYKGIAEITEYMTCAGYTQGGKDACQGDSGGPMTLNNVLVGVISFGYGCARPDYPGVYASVASHRDWMLGITSLYS